MLLGFKKAVPLAMVIPAGGDKGDQDLENRQVLGGAPTPIVVLGLDQVATRRLSATPFPVLGTSQGHIQKSWGYTVHTMVRG